MIEYEHNINKVDLVKIQLYHKENFDIVKEMHP